MKKITVAVAVLAAMAVFFCSFNANAYAGQGDKRQNAVNSAWTLTMYCLGKLPSGVNPENLIRDVENDIKLAEAAKENVSDVKDALPMLKIAAWLYYVENKVEKLRLFTLNQLPGDYTAHGVYMEAQMAMKVAEVKGVDAEDLDDLEDYIAELAPKAFMTDAENRVKLIERCYKEIKFCPVSENDIIETKMAITSAKTAGNSVSHLEKKLAKLLDRPKK